MEFLIAVVIEAVIVAVVGTQADGKGEAGSDAGAS